MPLYPKNPKVVNKKELVVTLVCGFLGLVACVLMVFQLCYTMLLCMEIPVYFTDGQFLVFFLLGFGTLLCLGGKVFISRHWKTMAFHGVITAIFSLITFLIWLFFLIGDFSAMASPLEEAFRWKVLLMDVVGILIGLAGIGSQLLILLAYIKKKSLVGKQKNRQ